MVAHLMHRPTLPNSLQDTLGKETDTPDVQQNQDSVHEQQPLEKEEGEEDEEEEKEEEDKEEEKVKDEEEKRMSR